jgi:hypothetical protein
MDVRGVEGTRTQRNQVEGQQTLLALGDQALQSRGDLGTSRQWYEKAYLVADRTGDGRGMALATLGLSGIWVPDNALVPRLRSALARVAPASPLGVRIRLRLAAERDRRTGGHDAILAALAEARQLTDPSVKVEALNLAHQCLLGPEHGALRRALATEMISESLRTGRRGSLLLSLLWQAVDMVLDAEPHAERRLRELRDLLAQQDHLAIGYAVNTIEVMLAIRTGRFAEAETAARECRRRGRAAGDTEAETWFHTQIATIRWYQGRLGELLPAFGKPTNPRQFALRALAAAQAGQRSMATRSLESVRLAELPRTGGGLLTMYATVEAANSLGDADTAALAYRLLSPFAEMPMVAGIGVACLGSVQHALGVASLATGELDRAVRHLHAAIEANLALAHWPAVLASRLRYIEALTLRGRPEDLGAIRLERAVAGQESASLGGERPTLALLRPDRGVGTVAPASSRSVVQCVRQGRRWLLTWAHRTVLVEHSVGMLHLAVLLANPAREVPAHELASGLAAVTPADPEPAAADDPDMRERARISVGKAIRRAVARIAGTDAALGDHLRQAVQTGTHCAYWPMASD